MSVDKMIGVISDVKHFIYEQGLALFHSKDLIKLLAILEASLPNRQLWCNDILFISWLDVLLFSVHILLGGHLYVAR